MYFASCRCPEQGEETKCCISCSDGSECNPEAKQLACELVRMEEEGKIEFDTKNPAGKIRGNLPFPDKAAAWYNVHDVCEGRMARR